MFDTSVTSYFSVVLVSMCDNFFVLYPKESYSAQEFLFMNYVTSTNNMLLRVVKILPLLLLGYQYFLSISLPFIILLECKLENLVVNCWI